MAVQIASLILLIVGAYAAAGLAFGLIFVVRLVGQLDHAAANARWPFRLMILPGAIALWPLLFLKWLAARREAHP